MKENATPLNICQKSGHLIAVLRATVIGVFLLISCVGLGLDCNSSTSARNDLFAPETQKTEQDVRGPTILISYSKETFKENPISSFMYFVPLISPTQVDRYTSPGNAQQVGIVAYKRKKSSKSFFVTCEFEMLGEGIHKNVFDPEEMIALFIDEIKKGQPLTNMLDYIQFEGAGFGRIEITGTIAGSIETVTEVDMWFNAKGQKSPVTIGLYDVPFKEGGYLYENRINPAVARVYRLTFKKTDKDPRMGIKVASLSKHPDAESFWDTIKGTIANLLIRPPKVDELGNATMLEFGEALLNKKPVFTFPKANNLKDSGVAVFPEKD